MAETKGLAKQIVGIAKAAESGMAIFLVDQVLRGRWQSIESAPMNGDWILVCRGEQQGVARWSGTHWSLGAMCYFNNPTHWMPLVDPPSGEEQGEMKTDG